MTDLNADDVRTLLRLYDEVIAELLRLDPLCQLSGWDTNDETKPAVERVRAALNDESPFWFRCCEHCGCPSSKAVGHDDTCRFGCNDDLTST